MQKIIFLSGVAILLLTSCTNSCFMAFAVTGCYDRNKDFPSISAYQKTESMGRTDVRQRWDDAVSCGAKYGDNNIIILNGKDWRDNPKDEREKIINSFRQCMSRKGYTRLSPMDCYHQDVCNY
ncbi:hypothetical protein H9Q10_09575 [Eikenella sp. S3360]|uniref:Lipoprotein n=1 Tax=Eikenella glucosivorans TaxID=2766967 RepID=A0ABS0NCB2_9NEIS|nr:hypothetical protein [Eikenella glucosivorans]MBH5329914.1 hypothetical protein [Eikenella glucosivorans]